MYKTEKYNSYGKTYYRVKRNNRVIANMFGSRSQAYRYIEYIKKHKIDRIGKMKLRI